jgi:hypothetical protein
MNTKNLLRVSSSLVGLIGLTAVSLGVGADAQAAGPVAPPRAVAKSATPGAAKNRFVGAHPLAGNPGTGYCYIDVPHVHDFAPDRPAVFQQVNDEYVFTGDPVPFGYEGDKTVFYGHHPVPLPPVVNVASATPPRPTFCFLKGPHYHDYPQPEAPGFKQKDNAVFYVGPIPPEVARERPQLERAVEVEYQPYVAQRPQVVVSPPPEWQGVVWVAPPQGPRLLVAPPAPQVVIAPPAPQVVIAPPAPQVVIAAPQPSVVVVPPHPPSVVIGVPTPGVFFMGGPGRGHGHGWGHGHGGWKGGGKGWKGGGRHW